MAHLGSMRRLANSATISARIGSLCQTKTPVSAGTPIANQHEDLCMAFRKFSLSPLEAELSASYNFKTGMSVIPQDIVEYRLPTIVKPLRITVPSLYDGAILNKDMPPLPFITEIKDPSVNIKEIQDTPSEKVVEKQAARLIIIRRKKMKKHKLRKLRKRLRFEVLKRRQKREYKKEKAFQAEQMAIVREAEAFDAASYVKEVLRLTKVKPDSRFFKGKRLPAFVVKELKEKEAKKRKYKEEHRQAIEEMKRELGLTDSAKHSG